MLASLLKELKKMKGARNLEAPKLADFVSKMMIALRDKGFEPKDFPNAFDFLKSFLETEVQLENDTARTLMETFSRYSQIMAKGDALEKKALACWMWYGGFLFGTGVDNVVTCARSLAKLLSMAREKNGRRVAQVTRGYYKDLLRSPRPAPEISRGFSAGDLARMVFPTVEKAIEADQEVLSKAMCSIFQVFNSYLEGLKSKDYLRQEIPKYLNGYKDLVEGDFKRFLNWIVALNRIASGKQTSYSEVSTSHIREKVKEMTKSSYAILIKSYNGHLRNSIAHASYRLNLERQPRLSFFDLDLVEIEFRDRNWKRRMAFTEFLPLFSEMSAVLDLSLILSDPEDRKLMKELCKHRDPGWWERIESKRGI